VEALTGWEGDPEAIGEAVRVKRVETVRFENRLLPPEQALAVRVRQGISV
jgi:hypothetical protein